MTYHSKAYHEAHGQQGFSLIELMIGLVLGMFVIGVIVTVFVQSKHNFNQDEQIAQMQENGRYALQLLSREVSHAGFLGGMSAVDTITLDSNTTVFSTSTNTCAEWFNPLAKPIEIYDEGTTEASCFGLGEAPGTRVLVVKRTDGKPTAVPAANKLYFRTPGQGGTIIQTTSAGSTPAGRVDWEYFVEVYYIKNDDSDGDGTSVPGLHRQRLVVTGGAINLTDDGLLVPGIRNFDLLYGIDTGEDDGIADEYEVSTSYGGTMNKVVSARVSVLAASVFKDHNYENNKQYTLYPSVVAPAYITGLSDAANGSNYYGRVFSTTAQIRNNAYRIQIYSIAKQ